MILSRSQPTSVPLDAPGRPHSPSGAAVLVRRSGPSRLRGRADPVTHSRRETPRLEKSPRETPPRGRRRTTINSYAESESSQVTVPPPRESTADPDPFAASVRSSEQRPLDQPPATADPATAAQTQPATPAPPNATPAALLSRQKLPAAPARNSYPPPFNEGPQNPAARPTGHRRILPQRTVQGAPERNPGRPEPLFAIDC